MSRHSKNCTAGSVFTYAEQAKLKHYGSQQQRLGTESMRKFEFCYLCLHFAKEPMCCDQGHLFCKSCIITYLVAQKKRQKAELFKWQRKLDRENQRQQDKEMQKLENQLQKFEKIEVRGEVKQKLVVPKLCQDVEKEKEVEEQKEKEEVIQSIAKRATLTKKITKDLVKISFWVPELTPSADTKIINYSKQPKRKLQCPATLKHNIRMKKLYNLKIKSTGEKFLCYACCSELSYKKAIAVKKCGHVFCYKCGESLKKETLCLICSNKVKAKDIIEIQEGHTGFSTHNKVESTVYKPAFVY